MLGIAANRYTQVRNATSTPGELLIALYDGLFRFMNSAKVAMEKKDLRLGRELLSKAYAIVSELYIALDHDVAPELCQQLEGLYSFAMDRLSHASRKGELAPLDEAIRVLTPLREAWAVAVPQAQRELSETGQR
jgi:flagellar secretion chaperone FliS